MTICMKKDQENLVNFDFRNCKLCTQNSFQTIAFFTKSIRQIQNFHMTVFQESVLEIDSLCNERQIESADLIMHRSVFCNACRTSMPIITFWGKQNCPLKYYTVSYLIHLKSVHRGQLKRNKSIFIPAIACVTFQLG